MVPRVARRLRLAAHDAHASAHDDATPPDMFTHATSETIGDHSRHIGRAHATGVLDPRPRGDVACDVACDVADPSHAHVSKPAGSARLPVDFLGFQHGFQHSDAETALGSGNGVSPFSIEHHAADDLPHASQSHDGVEAHRRARRADRPKGSRGKSQKRGYARVGEETDPRGGRTGLGTTV